LEADKWIENANNNTESTSILRPGPFPINPEEFLQHLCGFMDAEGFFYINIE